MKSTIDCQLIGAGPAGISLLIALYNQLATANTSQRNQLQGLLASLRVFDAADGGGVLGDYQINANTDAGDMVNSISDDTPFAAVKQQYLAQLSAEQVLISLPDVGRSLVQPLFTVMAQLLGDRLQCQTKVARIVKQRGRFTTYAADDQPLVTSNSVVLCCGGAETLLPELAPYADKTQLAASFLQLTQPQQLADLFHNASVDILGDIVIVGSSHSGFSCAWRLLNDPVFAAYIQARHIVILQRSDVVKLRCTPEFARDHDLPFDDKNDVCPTSGLVYRHAGLRKDAKDLCLDIQSNVEKRVSLVKQASLQDAAQRLEQASLIIQCAGFASQLPVIEIDGQIAPIIQSASNGELNDARSGKLIDGLFANGLGIKILPQGAFRGEASFKGSVDGVEPYPVTAYGHIIERLLARQQRHLETA